MQIILKEVPDSNGVVCLFDTRSNSFFPGGCVKNKKDTELLYLANNLVRKSPRTILEIVTNWGYNEDYGHAEAMLAKKYLDLNIDLLEKAKCSAKEKPIRKSKKLKIAKPEEIDPETGEVMIKVRKKAGRPIRTWTEEELAEIEAKKLAPKGRGRPRKDPNSVAVPYQKTGGKRGRPRIHPLVENTI